MSSRSQVKRITLGSRTLKFLREQARLSTRGAAKASGLKDGLINHLENGRITIRERHLQKLLTAYQATPHTYEMFASGSAKLPFDLRKECLELLRQMSVDQVRIAHPVLVSLSAHK